MKNRSWHPWSDRKGEIAIAAAIVVGVFGILIMVWFTKRGTFRKSVNRKGGVPSL